jgi:hypothetical protein
MINSTTGSCLVPPSNYTQIVRVTLISRDLTITSLTHFASDYEYYDDFELHSMSPEYLQFESGS